MKIVSAAEMRDIDRVTSERFGVPSLTLMENAGAAIAHFILSDYPQARRIGIICGRGNNGGDGFVVARKLQEAGCIVRLLLLCAAEELRGDAAAMFQKVSVLPLIARETAVLEMPQAAEIFAADLLVDAVLGTGFRPPVSELYAAAIRKMNESAAPVVAVDIPSGADADTMQPQTGTIARADAVVTFTAPRPAHVFAGLAARWDRLPHLAHIQDIISRAWTRAPYTMLLEKLSDQFVAISTPVGAFYPARKTTLIPNAVDLSRWRGTAGIRESLELLPQHKVIAIIGRLTPWKGQRVFLAAAQILAAQDPCYRFLIVGDDSVGGVSGYRRELEGLANQGDLQGCVQFLGRRDDVLDVMAACDVIVHASTQPEPFGVVIIEGMAMAKPISS